MLLFEIVRNFDYLKVGKYDFTIKEFCYLLLETFFESMRGKNCFIFFCQCQVYFIPSDQARQEGAGPNSVFKLGLVGVDQYTIVSHYLRPQVQFWGLTSPPQYPQQLFLQLACGDLECANLRERLQCGHRRSL